MPQLDYISTFKKIICMSVLPTCIACVPLSCLVPRGRKVGYEPPCWYWELNLRLNPLLEEKPVFLPAALSLQPQISSFPIPPKRDCIPAITGLHILSHQTIHIACPLLLLTCSGPDSGHRFSHMSWCLAASRTEYHSL